MRDVGQAAHPTMLSNTDHVALASGSRSTLLPHPSLVHPPIDPDLVELQVRARGDSAVLFREGSLEVRLIPGPLEHELRIEVGRLREQRRRLSGRGTGRPADLDAFDDRCDHVVVWCMQGRTVAAAACIFDHAKPRLVREDAAVEAYTTASADGHLDAPGRAFEVHRSFVAVGFGESEAGVALLRGIDAWLVRGRRPRTAADVDGNG